MTAWTFEGKTPEQRIALLLRMRDNMDNLCIKRIAANPGDSDNVTQMLRLMTNYARRINRAIDAIRIKYDIWDNGWIQPELPFTDI